MRCVECKREIEIGQDLIPVEECVLGFNGPVPLEDVKMFCSWGCLKKFCNGNGDDVEKVSRRIP